MPVASIKGEVFTVKVPFTELFFRPRGAVMVSSTLLGPDQHTVGALAAVAVTEEARLAAAVGDGSPRPALYRVPLAATSLGTMWAAGEVSI